MDEFEQSNLEKVTNDSHNTCYQNAIRYKEIQNGFMRNCKHGLFSLVFVTKLQSVSWSLAEFRHNKIVQLLRENCFKVCRQLQRKVRSRKHDV